MITICWEVSKLSEDMKLGLQSLKYGLHNKAQDDRGNPVETADTANTFFIVERLAVLDSFKKTWQGLTRYQ